MADYDETAEELDLKGLKLKAQLKNIGNEIEVKQKKLTGSTSFNEKLNRRVAIGLFATSEAEVEIVLIYGGFRALVPTCVFCLIPYLSSCTLGILECWIRHSR